MAWKGTGNPQPGHLRDQNAPGLAVGKAKFSTRGKTTKPAPKPRSK